MSRNICTSEMPSYTEEEKVEEHMTYKYTDTMPCDTIICCTIFALYVNKINKICLDFSYLIVPNFILVVIATRVILSCQHDI